MQQEWAENTVFLGYSQQNPCSVNILLYQVPPEGRMRHEVMSPFILSASPQGRAGILTLFESKLNFLHLANEYMWQYKVSLGCPEALGRWEQGAGATCAHHQCVPCAAGQSPPELLWLIPWEVFTAPAQRDWSTSHPHPEFSSFSINILPKLFARKVVSQPAVLPGWTSVK